MKKIKTISIVFSALMVFAFVVMMCVVGDYFDSDTEYVLFSIALGIMCGTNLVSLLLWANIIIKPNPPEGQQHHDGGQGGNPKPLKK